MILNPSNVITIAVPTEYHETDKLNLNYVTVINNNTINYEFKIPKRYINRSYIIEGFDLNDNFLECDELSNIVIKLKDKQLNNFKITKDKLIINSITELENNIIDIEISNVTINSESTLSFIRADDEDLHQGPWKGIVQLSRLTNNITKYYDIYNCYLNDIKNEAVFNNSIIKFGNNINYEVLLSDKINPVVNKIISNISNNSIFIQGNELIVNDNIIIEYTPPFTAIYKVKI